MTGSLPTRNPSPSDPTSLGMVTSATPKRRPAGHQNSLRQWTRTVVNPESWTIILHYHLCPRFGVHYTHHEHISQKSRDTNKNRLCSLAQFPLLRVGATHLYEHDRITLLEYMLRRYAQWPTGYRRLLGEIGEYVSTLTEDQINLLTEGGVADPSIDPNVLFDLDHPFPGISRVSNRLYEQFGIVTDIHNISVTGPLHCHTLTAEMQFNPRCVCTCAYVLHRPRGTRHLHFEQHAFDVGDGEKLYQGRVTFGMQWGLPTAEDWQPNEAPFDYFRRTHTLPFWVSDPPGIHIPDIVESFAKYLALRRIEAWAGFHLEPVAPSGVSR